MKELADAEFDFAKRKEDLKRHHEEEMMKTMIEEQKKKLSDEDQAADHDRVFESANPRDFEVSDNGDVIEALHMMIDLDSQSAFEFVLEGDKTGVRIIISPGGGGTVVLCYYRSSIASIWSKVLDDRS